MPIEFDSNGNPKPYEVVGINLEEFEAAFSQIPDINQRRMLFLKLNQYICDLYQTLFPQFWIQWFGGSYTTKKEIPGDIDLVNIIDYNALEPDPDKILPFLNTDRTSVNSKDKYLVDGYFVPVYQRDDPRRNITEDRIRYWINFFGKDRNKNSKALIEVSYNDIL